MKWFFIAALIAAALLLVFGIFAAITWFASDWVVSSLVTVTVLLWLCSWLVIAYGRDRVRAAAIGAVVASAAYWLLALGPWFQTNIGSTLLTSRLLAWVEATHRQPVQQQQVNAVFTTLDFSTGGYVTNNTVISGTGLVTTQPQYVVTTIPQAVPPPGMSHFQSAGHWSLVWLFAVAGGVLAVLLQRRPESSIRQAKERAP